MGADGDKSVDSINLIESMLELSNYALLGDSALTAFLGKLAAIGKVVVGLGFVIFIHELGHFLAAKTFGVRCDKFYIGFDVPIRIGPIRLPSTLGKFQWGETEYGIGIIPLGGYVKMLGQDDDPRKAKEEADRIRAGGTAEVPLDPRSFPAKPVWQRMIIISAGVVMNLISAVFLAGAAYFNGVPYTPAIVGNSNAGGPAWMANIQAGDQVLRVGANDTDDPNLRYQDMFQNIVLSGLKSNGKPVPVVLNRNGQRIEIDTFPSAKYDPDNTNPLLGFQVERSTSLSPKLTLPFSFIDAKKLGLQEGDQIVAVDGQQLPKHPVCDAIVSVELTRRLSAKWNQPVQLGIERPANKKSGEAAKNFEISLPPVPVKDWGVGFAIDSVTAVRPGSTGEKAGFQAGDKILAMDGQPVVNGFDLPWQFAAEAGREVTFNVERGSEQLELKLTSPEVPTFDVVSEFGSGELSLGGAGVAFGVTTVVSQVDASRVKQGSIQVGDELKKFRWSPSPEQIAEAKDFGYDLEELAKTSREFSAYQNVATVMENLQNLPTQSKFDLDVIREGKIVSTSLMLDYNPNRYSAETRGLFLESLTKIHQTPNVVEALKLGLWETKRRFFDVVTFLRMMFTGKVSVKHVAGPFRLFGAATSEASHGTSRLLLFLTLLSANLAILNFLPIPALDGGHMMFLSWEAIRGKPVDENTQINLTMIGVLSLLALMAFVILNDLRHLI